jgi:small-conductance mechanosensitive channel
MEDFQALIFVFIVVVVAAVIAVAVLAAAFWVVVVVAAVLWFAVVGLYKLFTASWKRAKSTNPKDILHTTGAIASGIAVKVSDEFRVSNPFVKALVFWTCRILGLVGCIGGIGCTIDGIRGKAGPDDPGTWGGILILLVFSGMTAYGFWPRRKKQENRSSP